MLQLGTLLLNEYTKRRTKNPSFSLRSFARTLGVSPATLSQLISGKRTLGAKAAVSIANALALEPTVRSELFSQTIRDAARPRTKAALRKTRASETATLDPDAFQVIASWEHFAVLSLGDIPNAKADPHWIAKRLAISPQDARVVFERLVRLGLVEIKGTTYKQTGANLKIKSAIPSAAIRNYHRQILEKAAESLERDDVAKREFGALSFALDENQLELVKKEMRAFRQKISKITEQGASRTRVFTLATQLFPLSLE